MVTVPRSNPGPAPVITSVVRGEAKCFADPSGHNYSAPSTTVELYDRSRVPITGRALLASEITAADGTFVVVVQGLDLRRIDWALRLVNQATRDTHTKESRMIVAAPSVEWASPGHYHVTFDIGPISVLWRICSFAGRPRPRPHFQSIGGAPRALGVSPHFVGGENKLICDREHSASWTWRR